MTKDELDEVNEKLRAKQITHPKRLKAAIQKAQSEIEKLAERPRIRKP